MEKAIKEETETSETPIKGTSCFVGGSYTYEETTIATSLYVPKEYSSDKECSLLIYFHNVGGRGSTPFWSDGCGDDFSKSIIELTNDSTIIFAPRCPMTFFWAEAPYAPGWYNYESTPISKPMSAVISYIYNEIIAKYSIDMSRIWAYGDSLGSGATWDLLLREPNLLAGAVPVAGYNDPTEAANVRDDMAVWAVHTAQDKAVNVRGDRAMTAALRNMGRNVIYTEYDSSNPLDKARWNGHWEKSPNTWEHHAWVVAYKDRAIAEWLTDKKKADSSTAITSRFTDISPTFRNYKAICYITDKGFLDGTSESTFDPDGNMTVELFMSALGRYAGVEASSYTKWALNNGILTEGDGLGADSVITVGQICTVLGRFSNFKSAKYQTGLTLDVYSDADSIVESEKDGLTWAIDSGVYMGHLGENSLIRSRNTASRALASSILYSYIQIFGK